MTKASYYMAEGFDTEKKKIREYLPGGQGKCVIIKGQGGKKRDHRKG